MNIECPYCHAVNDGRKAVDQCVRCVSCDKLFGAPGSKEVPRLAALLEAIAGLLCVAGVIAGLYCVTAVLSGSTALGFLTTTAGLTGFALLFYLVAQAVRIRALLEKRKD